MNSICTKPTHRPRSLSRAAWIAGIVIVLVAAVIWGVSWRIAVRRYGDELILAEREYKAGNFGLAQRRLSALEARWPGEAEVAFRLGLCELARGRREEALAAWARVPAGSEFSGRAAALRGQQLTNMGRFAPAEAVLESALREAGPDSYQIGRMLGRLYRLEGRTDDVRRLFREWWSQAPDPAVILKALWALDKIAWSMDAWALALAKADADDDRVWLGRANLAVMTGRFQEANELLANCQRSRPTDIAVWRARLKLAQATGRVDEAQEALAHIPASSALESEVLSLRAWIAGHRSNPDEERKALQALVEHDPGNADALERLAVFATERGQAGESKRLHGLKAKVDIANDRYRKIVLYESDLAARAGELAGLAATLGRRFDARAWSLIQSRGKSGTGPRGADLAWDVDDGVPGSMRNAGPNLVDLVPDLAPSSKSVAPNIGVAATRPEFADEAETAGLRFHFDNGETPLRQVPEIMSGGVAVLDYDGDGWLDVYAVQGGPFALGVPRADGDHLFHNNGDGTFQDMSMKSGIASLPRNYGVGVAVGDYDNDDDPDLFISRLNSYALYRNRGDGTFEDVTAPAGLAGLRDTTASAAFADLDNDGDLDLYVCHYTVYDPLRPVLCPKDKDAGEYMYCDPMKLQPAPDHVFRNDGGRFVDVTAESGCTDPDGRSLGVVAAHLDDDDKIDLFVANDGTANLLFRNLGGFRFEETGHLAGVAAGANGGFKAGMGIACGDFDGDGRLDLVVTNFYGEASTFYANLGGGLFSDRTADSHLDTATRYLLGFGTAFLDYDNNGQLDLMTVNGHVNDNRPYTPFAMPVQLLAGDGRGKFIDVSASAGPPWSILRVGRGLAKGDLDNDGRIDAVVLSQNDALAYFHNRTKGGHFLTLRLNGTTSNRDAVGARVTIVAGGHRQVAQQFGGGSYLSAGDPRLHFGLATSDRVESVEVRWPSGRMDRFRDLDADRGYRLIEGDEAPKPLKGFRR
jgi:enediyne biosynthesis protein E4